MKYITYVTQNSSEEIYSAKWMINLYNCRINIKLTPLHSTSCYYSLCKWGQWYDTMLVRFRSTGCRSRDEWNLRLRVSYTCLLTFDSSPFIFSNWLFHGCFGDKFRGCRTVPNTLPSTLRQITSYEQFRRHLKAHLFWAYGSRRFVTFNFLRHTNTTTHSLTIPKVRYSKHTRTLS